MPVQIQCWGTSDIPPTDCNLIHGCEEHLPMMDFLAWVQARVPEQAFFPARHTYLYESVMCCLVVWLSADVHR